MVTAQRQISDPGQPFVSDQVGVQQQVTASQQISPSTSPLIGTHPLLTSGLKVGGAAQLPSPSPLLGQIKLLQSPHAAMTAITSSSPTNDNSQPPPLPPKLSAIEQQPASSSLTAPPRLQLTSTRPALQGFTPLSAAVRQDGVEINRQLRDLLQRQQFKKLDEQLMPGKGQQRVWPPPASESGDTEQTSVAQPAGDTTFRHPLPPGMSRPPRAPTAANAGIIIRQSVAANPIAGALRMQGADGRMQNVDLRMRLLLQHQQVSPNYSLTFAI